MKNFRNQQGVALLFALGMLTILLVTGMAFVANALTAQKVAANNSARTQSRMFAQSAISRVLVSAMLLQSRMYNADAPKSPGTFDSVYSYSTGDNDGLTGDNSLLKLPTDSSVVDENVAKDFNDRFKAWGGHWVYFYDNDASDSDTNKEIIGRAAWQVLSSAPQILAPVFLSGHLKTDGNYDWTPSSNRWGREIDEVYLNNSPIFRNAATAITKQTAIKDFSANLYPILQSAWEEYPKKDAVKRWIENWLMPDIRGDNVMEPVPVIPEVYSAMDGKNKSQYLRFNISEILKDNLAEYGVSEDSDPWYARFGIKSTPDSIAGNNSPALDVLTANSPETVMGDTYDYKLKADPANIDNHERPSLPFLRRIGNWDSDVDGGNPTFANVETWRKQIAANFNDYCDADHIPTSDQPAENWCKPMIGDDGTENTAPTYTGNEKTPYLYELGFRMGFFKSDANDKVNVKAPGIKFNSESLPVDSNGNYTVNLSTYVGIAPIVKLANIYDFDTKPNENKEFSDFTAGVDLGALEVKIIPTKVNLKVDFTQQDASPGHTTFTIPLDEITGTIEDKKLSTQTVKIENNLINNKDGKNPYPLLIPKEITETETAKITASCSLKITKDIVNNAGGSIPDNAVIDKVTVVSIDEFKVTSVKINVKRAYLAATYDSKTFGLDYVRPLGEIAAALDADTGVVVKVEESSNPEESNDPEKIPGIYLGGIRNYDPRQNLNPDDWYRALSLTSADNIKNPAGDAKLKDVMNVDDVPGDDDPRQGVANHVDNSHSEYDKFRPVNSDASKKQDFELVEEPGYLNNDSSEKRLSTAFIRNAPMMSPWEIGLIHRGVKWQTLNIRKACDPDDNSKAITLAGHAPTENWTSGGTSYTGGDGAILDQIKMTDQCSTYGKINVNKLRSNYPEYNSIYDKEIIRALFDNLRYDQPMKNFYARSTRNSDSQNFLVNNDNPADGGDKLTIVEDDLKEGISDNILNNMTASRDSHTSRAQFLNWKSDSSNCLATAFGAVEDGKTDAAREEIVGKTINLLCAESVAPTQIYVVIVAQSIRDVGGYQRRRSASNELVEKDCTIGQMDFKDGVLLDEITGEVKMFVTIDRDINTGRMTVRRIDYLE